MERIRRNIPLERKIVWAIRKASVDDISRIMRDFPLDTHNFLGHYRGDAVNTNLRLMDPPRGVQILPFHRSGYSGRIVVDQRHRITYSVTTQENLRAVSREKHRNNPHFLQTFLGVENRSYEADCKQMTLMPMDAFDEETLRKDYAALMADFLSPGEGYVHYIVAYDPAAGSSPDIQLYFLDRDFDEIDAVSLNEYMEDEAKRRTVSARPQDRSGRITGAAVLALT